MKASKYAPIHPKHRRGVREPKYYLIHPKYEGVLRDYQARTYYGSDPFKFVRGEYNSMKIESDWETVKGTVKDQENRVINYSFSARDGLGVLLGFRLQYFLLEGGLSKELEKDLREQVRSLLVFDSSIKLNYFLRDYVEKAPFNE